MSFMSFYGWMTHSALALNNIPSWEGTIVCLAIYSFNDSLVCSKFGQLFIKLLKTSMCRCLCEHKLPISLGKYSELCGG